MKVLKRVNWFPLLPAFFTIGLAYFLTLVVNGSWEKVDHLTVLLLFFPGLMFGFWLQQSLVNISGPYSILDVGGSRWQRIGLLVGSLAGLVLMVFLISYTFILALIPSNSLKPEMLERAWFIQSTTWILAIFMFFWLIFCRGRYVAVGDNLTVIEGEIIYPGTKVLLRPWLNYTVDSYSSFIKMAADMKIRCKDGTFLVKIRTEAQIDISEAKVRKIAKINYWNTTGEVRHWLLNHLMNEAEKNTILDYVLSQKNPIQYDAAGIPIKWNGKAHVEIKSRA